MKYNPLPTRSLLNELLRYDPETGNLFWRHRGAHHFAQDERFSAQGRANMWNGRRAGKQAFIRRHERGYLCGVLGGVSLLAHRVIWKMNTGDTPNIIDHLNGDTSDNRMCNLRNTDHLGNCQNQKLQSNNTTGIAGVTRTQLGTYKVSIGCKGETIYLGCFKTLAEASEARQAAAASLGFHENHGRE